MPNTSSNPEFPSHDQDPVHRLNAMIGDTEHESTLDYDGVMYREENLISVGDRAHHVDGGPELVVIARYFAGPLNGERAVCRWLDQDGEVQEFDFYAGHIRPATIRPFTED